MRLPPAVSRVSLRVERKPDAIAISPRLRGQHGDLFRRANAAALQRLAQDGLLESELCRVVRVLILATAARAEVPARRRNPLRRGLNNFFSFGGCVAALVLNNSHACPLAGQRQRHKQALPSTRARNAPP